MAEAWKEMADILRSESGPGVCAKGLEFYPGDKDLSM